MQCCELKIVSAARKKSLTAGIKKGGFITRNESPLFIGGKWRYNYGITVLHRAVNLNRPVVEKVELNYN